MNTSINCGLKGQYKVDIFRGGGKSREFVESTDWFSNDITNVGLNYPFTYPFAKCFMFLSLGSGYSNANNRNSTGLGTGLGSFTVYNPTTGGYSRQPGQYIGWEGYEIGGPHDSTYDGSLSSACGTVLTNQGVNFYRGWTIPTGSYENGNVVADNLTIGQFMTSPSSGSDVNGNKAFSLVSRTIVIPSGYSATITYQLSINFSNYQSGYTFFSGNNDTVGGYFNTGNASTGANGSNEFELLSGWSTLSGIYRQIFPAIQMIDGVGACVIPKMGADLEPSKINCQKSVFYLSPDISQFAVSKFGGAPTGEYGAYNSYGLMANYAEFVSQVGGDLAIHSDKEDGSIFSDANTWYYSGDAVNTPDGSSQNGASTTEAEILTNIRLEGMIPISNYNSGALPASSLNYQTKSYIGAKNSPVAFATPGRLGFNSSFSDYGQKAVYSSYLKRLPIDTSITGTGTAAIPIRNKYVTKRSILSPINSYGTNSRYGSLTLGYNTASNTIGSADFHPYIDFLFFDDQGKGANTPHYRLIPDIYLYERGSGVSIVRFDITGTNGSIPNSINRFYSAFGFMGDGNYPSPNTNLSGINEQHPLLEQIVYEGTNTFIPRGDKKAGYLFTGQLLNENVPGDITYNSNTGWGAVYGVVSNTGFYTSQIDTCLVNNNDWKNYNEVVGDIFKSDIPSGTHASLILNGYYYGGTVIGSVNSAAQDYIWKINLDNPFDYQIVNSPIGIIPSMTYCTGDGYIYAVGNSGCIAQISTGSTLTATAIKIQANSTPFNIQPRAYHAITNDGKLLYIGLNGNYLGDIFTYDTKNSFSASGTNQIGSIFSQFNVHWMNYDGANVYATNSNSTTRIAKIPSTGVNTTTFAYTTASLGSSFTATDDQAVSSDNTTGGFLYLGGESAKIIKKVNKADLSYVDYNVTNTSWGLSTDDNYVYSACSDESAVLKLNKSDLSLVNKLLTPNSFGYPNELITSGDYLYTTFWNLPDTVATEFAKIPTTFNGIPNPLSNNNIFWPNVNNKIGLRITGVNYYLKGYGNYDDSTDFYASGQKQAIGDIIYTGINPSVSLFDYTGLNGTPYFFFVNGSNVKITSTDPFFQRSGIFKNYGSPTTGAVLPYFTGWTNYPYNVYFSGFDFSDLANSRLIGKNLTALDISNFVWSGATNDPYFASDDSSATNKYYLAYSDDGGNTTTILNNTGLFKVLPTQWKKPLGKIHHLENIGNVGYRLLPNYATANNVGVNTYLPVTGGKFPGMSTQNGMELYLTLSWTGR